MTGLEGHKARKRFGQNFLHDQHWIDRIVQAIDARAGDAIVEIGPGQAALTRELIKTARHVTAVEIDRDLAAWLKTQFSPEELTLVEADALSLDWKNLAAVRHLRIVGNLPYNISSPLLFRLIDAAPCVRDQHFMLQREVVDRMVAEPGSKVYGRLSVMLQRHYKLTKLFDVPPGAFNPAPQVVSSVVRMVPKTKDEIPELNEELFASLVMNAFAQRRKTIRNALSRLMDDEALCQAGIDPASRAEVLPQDAFVRLTLEAMNRGVKPYWPGANEKGGFVYGI